MKEPKQYAERNPVALDKQGNYYCRHVSAMTAEGLHAKSDIAAELAFRDAEIDRLKGEVEEARHVAADLVRAEAERWRLRANGPSHTPEVRRTMVKIEQELSRVANLVARRRHPRPPSPVGDHVVLDPVIRIYLEKREALERETERIALNAINEWRVMECGLPGLKMSYEDVVLSRRACHLPKSLGKSPVGLCVYDRSKDPNHESCIVCGHREK